MTSFRFEVKGKYKKGRKGKGGEAEEEGVVLTHPNKPHTPKVPRPILLIRSLYWDFMEHLCLPIVSSADLRG